MPRRRFWKPSVEREVDAEVAYHLEMRIAENVAAGMDPAAAREAAVRRFGDVDQITADCRSLGRERDRTMRLTDSLAALRQDVRYALRHLGANRVFTLVATLTIALGVGTATTIFGIADAVLLRPLPFRDPERLVRVWEANPTTDQFSVSEPNYLDWQVRARSFSLTAAYTGARLSLTGTGEPERLVGTLATPSLFTLLGAAPLVGRALVEADVAGGSPRQVVVISYALWQRRFAGAPSAVGQTMSLDGTAYEVVGVMPRGFDFPGERDVYLPLAPSPASSRGNHVLSVAARLRPNVTVAQAAGEMKAIAGDLARQYPESNGEWSTTVRTFDEWIVPRELRDRVLVLLGAVGVLLLMACVNVANLMLARAAARQRDISVRAALGAGRSRIARQLMTESLVLAAIGAVVGIALAFAAVPLLRSVAADSVPRFDELRVDWRVLAFGAVASALTGVLFGLVPAVQASRGTLAEMLRSGTRLVGAGRTRGALIVASVALAMLLLVGAGLLGGSFARLMGVDPGFRADGVLTASIALPNERYGEPAQRNQFWGEMVRRLATIPGVSAAGATNIAPFSGGNTGIPFTVPGRDAASFLQADWRAVTPGYFDALRIRLKRGRLLRESDGADAEKVLLVSETMARQVWPNEDPIGKQIKAGPPAAPPFTVVGVVGDIRDRELDGEGQQVMYIPSPQIAWGSMWLVVRARCTPATSACDPGRLANAVRREVWAIDKTLPVSDVQPLSRFLSEAAAQPRLTALVFALFGGAALTLAVVGVYGIVSYGVTQQTREIGVRLALGARPSRILGRVVAHGVRLAAAGIVLGLGAALALSRYLESLLFGVTATDAVTYAAVAALLALAAALASTLPAAAAARLDPVRALRDARS